MKSQIMVMLPGMAQIVATWLLMWCVFGSIGWGCLRLLNCGKSNAFGWLTVWLGWCMTLVFLQLWQLFLPVGGVVLMVVALSGLTCLCVMLCDVRSVGAKAGKFVFAAIPRQPVGLFAGMTYACVMGVFVFWLANRAMGPLCLPYDAGLYHLNCIRWMSEYPLVPGLANLHIRFGAMGSYFLYMALLDSVPWVYRSWNLAHGFLLLCVVSQLVWSLWRVVLIRKHDNADIMGVLLLPAVVKVCFLETASTAYDLPVFLMGVVIAVVLCRMSEATIGGMCGCVNAKSNILAHAILVLSLVSAAVVVKASALFMAGLVFSAVTIMIWRSYGEQQYGVLLVSPFLMPGLLIGGWVIRNIMISGYPFAPVPLFGFPVEWRIPQNALVAYNHVIMAWARQPHADPSAVLSNWQWFLPWARGVINYWILEFTVPSTLAVLGGVWLLLKWLGGKSPVSWRGNVILVIPLITLVAWFCSAPDIRFAGVAFWWLGAGLFVNAFFSICSVSCTWWRRSVLIGICVVLIFYAVGGQTKYIRPGPLAGGWYPMPKAQLKEYVTGTGLRLYIPEQGDQVWDSPLPATPYPVPYLALREDNDLQSGFVIRCSAGDHVGNHGGGKR